MAKNNVQHSRIIGVKATTVGMLQGTFFSLIGLETAISYTISAGAQFTQETESLLRGLTFGLAHGLLAIIFVPIIYFAIGWVLGSLQGVIINALVSISGGIVVETQKEEE